MIIKIKWCIPAVKLIKDRLLTSRNFTTGMCCFIFGIPAAGKAAVGCSANTPPIGGLMRLFFLIHLPNCYCHCYFLLKQAGIPVCRQAGATPPNAARRIISDTVR